jgi:hypothetical protein
MKSSTSAEPRRRADVGGGSRRTADTGKWASVKKSMASFKKNKRGTVNKKNQMSIVKADI